MVMIRRKLGCLYFSGLFSVVLASVILGGCGSVSGNGSTSGGNWNLSMTRTGSFAPGGTGEYEISATNGSSGATGGMVSVSDSLPSIFTASSVSGTGWSCTL